MDIFGQMPSPPPMYQMATDSFGNPVSTMTYAPPPQQYYQQPYPQQPVMVMQQPQMNVAPSLGANFSGLIGTGVSLPIETAVSMPGEKPKRKRRKKTDRFRFFRIYRSNRNRGGTNSPTSKYSKDRRDVICRHISEYQCNASWSYCTG